jgi:hypothetical protein
MGYDRISPRIQVSAPGAHELVNEFCEFSTQSLLTQEVSFELAKPLAKFLRGLTDLVEPPFWSLLVAEDDVRLPFRSTTASWAPG